MGLPLPHETQKTRNTAVVPLAERETTTATFTSIPLPPYGHAYTAVHPDTNRADLQTGTLSRCCAYHPTVTISRKHS